MEEQKDTVDKQKDQDASWRRQGNHQTGHRSMHTLAAARGGRGGGRVNHGRAEGAERCTSGLRSPAPLWVFVNRDREPRHQQDMRAFVMAARSHAKTGKLSERVFLPLVDLAASTEFRNSALRTETNVFFFTLYNVEGASDLWGRVFEEFSKLTERGSLRDTSYSEHDRRRDAWGHDLWEPKTWADVALPIARFMVEVAKRFRDAVLADKDFQGWATDTLPTIVIKWKARKGDPSSLSRTQELEVDDAMANLSRVMGAALRILRTSEEAKASRDKARNESTSRSELFHLPKLHQAKSRDVGGGYDGPGRFSRLTVRRHDNDAERIADISVPPTAGEILSERPPYVPRNTPSTWEGMKHLEPLEAGSAAAIMDVHFRLLRQDFVEPLRDAVLGYRQEHKEPLTCQRWLLRFVGTPRSGVSVWLEFDKPDTVRQLSEAKQKDYWEKHLAVANMVVLCENLDTVGSSVKAEDEVAADPMLVFAVISEKDVHKLSKARERGRIGVTFDSCHQTVSGIERMLDRGGLTGDGRLLMLQPSNSYFAYRPILSVIKSEKRETIPFADILLPPAEGETIDTSVAVRPPRYLLDGDNYNLSDIAVSAENTNSPASALSSVNMLDSSSFPVAELLEKTTLDTAQLTALLAALSREVTLIQGPPGTGKTFVGAKVVRLLLTNRALQRHWEGPIMCVCLTNHALDQFLGDLLDAGVEGIVRVGGSCKSERLQPFLLKERSRGRKDACGKHMWDLRKEMEEVNEDIRKEWEWEVKAGTEIQDFCRSVKMVEGLIDAHASRHFQDAIMGGDDRQLEDGFQQVGRRAHGVKDWLQGHVASRAKTLPGKREINGPNRRAAATKDCNVNDRDKQNDQLSGQDCCSPPKQTAFDARDKAAHAINGEEGGGLGLYASAFGWNDFDSDTAEDESQQSDEEGAIPAKVEEEVSWQFSTLGPADAAEEEDWEILDEEQEHESFVNDQAPTKKEEEGVDGAVHLVETVTRLRLSSLSYRPSTPGQSSRTPSLLQKGVPPSDHGREPLRGLKIARGLPIGGDCGTGFAHGRGVGFAVGRGGRIGGKSVSSSINQLEASSEARVVCHRGVHANDGYESDDLHQSGFLYEEGQVDPDHALDEKALKDTHVTEVNKDKCPWKLSRDERWSLCRHWQRLEAELSRGRLVEHIKRFSDVKQKHDNHRTQGDRAVLQEAEVVGMTTTGVAMNQALVEALGARIVIVEEAAEVLEAHILAALTQATQHLILIGDHLQLRPKAEVYRLTKESRRGFDLDVSMFERLVEERRVPVFDLATQRRMRPDIADLIRPSVYPNLGDAPHVESYPAVKGMRHPLFFMDHAVMEDKSGTVASSKTNRYEARIISGLVRYLLKQGYTEKGDITVLTPYLGQLFVLKDVVGRSSVLHVQVNDRDRAEMNRGDNSSDADDEEHKPTEQSTSPADVEVSNVAVSSMIRMATVDNFQGEESKIIIISLVRSNPNCDIGFLRSSNRVNVMLSRAQHGMYIVGNAGMLQKKSGTMWSECVLPTLWVKQAIGPALELQCARHQDSFTSIRKPEEFELLAGDGGCSRPCSLRLPCGHTCARRCHPDDPEHRGVRCNEPCPRLHHPCEHPCTLVCGDSCGPCREKIVVVDLPCGHRASNVVCPDAQAPESVRCFEPVRLEIPGCGHILRGRCTALRAIVQDPTTCFERCGKPLPCGHSCAAACGRCTKHTLEIEKKPTPQEGTSIALRDQLGASHGPGAKAEATAAVWRDISALEQEEDDEEMEASAAAKATMLEAANNRTHHETCKIECGRPRPCGHRCRLPCHEGIKCLPCPEKCAISCEHSACNQTCIDPCAPCAQDCTWFCPHEAGPCQLPCGAPCLRLPCDRRCDRLLSCGHQCPSVCGEDCPSTAYCRKCGGSGKEMNQVVDMLEFTTLKDQDPSLEPIIVLGCGHCYTLSTLDGYMDISASYDKDPRSGEWIAPKPLGSDCSTLKPCPDCRTPLRGVSRYKRVTNKAKIDMAEIKHAQWCRSEIRSAETDLTIAASEAKNRVKRMKQAEGTLRRVEKMSRFTPSTQVYEAAMAKLLLRRLASVQVSTVSRIQPDGSIHVQALIGLGRLQTLKLEHQRPRFSKKVGEYFQALLKPIAIQESSPTEARPAEAAKKARRRGDILQSAHQLGGLTSRTYDQELKLLLTAINAGKAVRALRAEAEAKMAIAELHLQGAHSVIVSKRLASLQQEISTPEIARLATIGMNLVRRGVTACREVAASPLESVRQQHEERLNVTLANLSLVDKTLRKAGSISDEEVEIVKSAAANTDLYGGVTKWYRCPNGHTYGVGDCGQLNAGGTCNECGAFIGGPGFH